MSVWILSWQIREQHASQARGLRGAGKSEPRSPLPKGRSDPQNPFPQPTNITVSGTQGALEASSSPSCSPLTFLSTTNSFSAAVRLLISTSYLCAAGERTWHCHRDNSVLQTLTEQSGGTSMPRAAWQWPTNRGSCTPGARAAFKRELIKASMCSALVYM